MYFHLFLSCVIHILFFHLYICIRIKYTYVYIEIQNKDKIHTQVYIPKRNLTQLKLVLIIFVNYAAKIRKLLYVKKVPLDG